MKSIKKIIFFVFCLQIIITACNTQKDEKFAESEIHPALQKRPLPSGLGVNIHFFEGNENDLQMLTRAGVEIVRMDVSWASVEKSPGKYDFSRHDQLIRDLEQRNIRLLFIIDYGNPLYDNGMAPHSDEARAAYVKFCSALTKRYAGRNIIWELWNEPNLDHFWKPKANVDDYIKWCKAVVPVIRKNDPGASIIAPATSSVDIPFLEACFKQGLLTLVDGISVHPYRNANLGPETAVADYHVLSAMIAQYKPAGKKIPIISGEWGYSTSLLSPELQGKYLARQWLSNIAESIPISIWYDWHDDGQDPKNTEHNFGTVKWDYQPKPAYYAMKTLIHELDGYLPHRRFSLGAMDDFVVILSSADKIKLAIWTTDEPHEIDISAYGHITEIVGHLGDKKTVPSDKMLPVDDSPLYLTLSPPYPNWLEFIIKAEQMNYVEAQEIARLLLKNNPHGKFTSQLLNALEHGSGVERTAAFYVLNQLANKLSGNSEEALSLYHLILKKERDALNIKHALNGLSKIASVKSLTIVEPLLQDPMFHREAANFYLQVAFKLVGKRNFDQVEKLLVKAASFSPRWYTVERIVEKMKEMGAEVNDQLLDRIAKETGFIKHWWVAGPFPNDDDVAERTAYFPEQKINFALTEAYDSLLVKWQKIELEGIYAVIPFAKFFGKKQGAAYAYTELKVPADMPAKFKIGSNDGVVCWLNGEKVHENFIGRKLTVDEDEVEVQLKKGVNRILLKVINQGANWEACLRVCDGDGIPLNLSKFSIE